MVDRGDDTLSISSQLEEVIKCAICLDVPIQPKVLPCQHSFCYRCIHPAYVSDVQQGFYPRDRFQCPICREIHPVPTQGLSGLQTDYRVNILKDIVQRRRHLQGKKLCAVCSIFKQFTTATFFCMSCGTLLCSKCRQKHEDSSLYQGHAQVQVFSKSAKCLKCQMHPGELVQHFCKDCEELLCTACSHDLHASHRVVGFVSVEEADTSYNDKIIGYLQEILDDFCSQRQHVQEMLKRNRQNMTRVTDDLSQVHLQIRALKQREQQLKKLHRYHEEVSEDLEEFKFDLDNAVTGLHSVFPVLNKAIHPLPEQNHITVSSVALQSVQNTFTNVVFPTRQLDTFEREYFSQVGSFDDIPSSFCHLTVFDDIEESVINANVKVLWRNDLESYDVHFLPDGSRGIVCTGQKLKWKLHLVDFNGQLSTLPPYLAKYNPCECRIVTSAITSSVAVTHRKQSDGLRLPFTVIYTDGKVKTSFIQTSPDQLSLCSLTVTQDRNVAFTFMDHNEQPKSTSIRCHDLKGRYVWCSNTSYGASVGGMISPYYIIGDHMNRLIVSDHHGYSVNIYDCTGAFLISFPKLDDMSTDSDNEDDVRPKPSGICVDSRNNIFVAFPTHNVISKFTPNGEFIKHVVHTGGKPRGISLLDDRYLAVGTWAQGLCLYDLGGDDNSTDAEPEPEQTEEAEPEHVDMPSDPTETVTPAAEAMSEPTTERTPDTEQGDGRSSETDTEQSADASPETTETVDASPETTETVDASPETADTSHETAQATSGIAAGQSEATENSSEPGETTSDEGPESGVDNAAENSNDTIHYDVSVL